MATDPRTICRRGGRPCRRARATIGEMARAYGVTLRTLRFYEDRTCCGRAASAVRAITRRRPRAAGDDPQGQASRLYAGRDRRPVGAEDGGKTDFEERLRPAKIVDQLAYIERQRREIDEVIAQLKATRERWRADVETAGKRELRLSCSERGAHARHGGALRRSSGFGKRRLDAHLGRVEADGVGGGPGTGASARSE